MEQCLRYAKGFSDSQKCRDVGVGERFLVKCFPNRFFHKRWLSTAGIKAYNRRSHSLFLAAYLSIPVPANVLHLLNASHGSKVVSRRGYREMLLRTRLALVQPRSGKHVFRVLQRPLKTCHVHTVKCYRCDFGHRVISLSEKQIALPLGFSSCWKAIKAGRNAGAVVSSPKVTVAATTKGAPNRSHQGSTTKKTGGSVVVPTEVA